jgi:hypothetical protein
MRFKLLLALLLVGGLAGCNEMQCTRSTDCQGSLICDNLGACVVPPDLAGTKPDVGDGGTDDGGVDSGATPNTTDDLAVSDDGAAPTD